MAAAVIVATTPRPTLSVFPLDRRVYLRGWGDAEDPPPGRSAATPGDPGHGGGQRGARVGRRLRVDDVGPSRPVLLLHQLDRVRRDALGIDPARGAGRGGPSDRRTGGLAYHGGPGSNYITHSLATMAEGSRRSRALGLVSGVGMHMNKHVFAAVLSTRARRPLDPARRSRSRARPRWPWTGTVVEAFEGPHGWPPTPGLRPGGDPTGPR